MDQPPAGAMARKINREAVVLLGWGRAILLQLAHPLVAAALSDYSGFRHGAGGYLRRARRTVGAMLDLTFGTPDDQRRIVRSINAIHDQVRGHLAQPVGIFPAGTPYRARDPRLLCWVHATLVESLVVAYEQFVDPLAPDESDQYTVDAAWLAHELGVGWDLLPDSYAGIRAYMRAQYDSGEIAVGDDARALAAALLAPPLGPAAAPLFRVTRLITVGLLPDPIRQAYGFSWEPRHERAFRRAVILIRRTRRLLPAMLREWPAARLAA